MEFLELIVFIYLFFLVGVGMFLKGQAVFVLYCIRS